MLARPLRSRLKKDADLSKSDGHVGLLGLLHILCQLSEFGESGYRATFCTASRTVQVFKQASFRGHWRQAGQSLVWTSCDPSSQPVVVSSSEEAARSTMLMVLQTLMLRRRDTVPA